jgi:hypothetical protein
MQNGDVHKISPLAKVLAAVVGLSIFMGAGPGLRLVNPDTSNPDAVYIFFGMPVIYMWVLLWCVISAAAVVAAYFKIWLKEK